MKKLIAVLLVSVFALSACGGSAESVTNLGVNDFTQKIADPSVTLLDVRTPAEFAAGHIAGAINIDFESGEFKQDIQALDKTKTYAVYCRSGNRAGQAIEIMKSAGFTGNLVNGGSVANAASMLGLSIVTD